MRLKNKKENLDAFRQKCRDNGLSITPQRLAIYELLLGARNHPRTEEVFEQVKRVFPEISLDTVYRTLNTFTQIGLLNVVEGYGEAKRYDPDTQSHHHFRCLCCNRLIDFEEASFSRLKIPGLLKKKYKVSNIKVLLEGVCDQCISKKG